MSEWLVQYGACPVPKGYAQLDDDAKRPYERMATEYLWRWTGRSLGLDQVAARPCREGYDPVGSTFYGDGGPLANLTPFRYLYLGDQWARPRCGSCAGDSCSCFRTSSIRLPGPIDSVVSVLIDGETIDPTRYRVDNRVWLIGLDGLTWPTGQDLGRAPTEDNTWQVTYNRGVPVPVGGQLAAGVLAIELWKAACSPDDCGLPRRFQTITRQGVTVAAIDTFDGIDHGYTGIWLIDSWVASMVKPAARPSVRSPDYRSVHRTTGRA